MFNNISNLGAILDKKEQKTISGGFIFCGPGDEPGFCCEWCPDGSCNGYVATPFEPCPIAAPCSF